MSEVISPVEFTEGIPIEKEELAKHDYSTLETWVLEDKQHMLTSWLELPDLRERQQVRINKILSHLAFELSMREVEQA